MERVVSNESAASPSHHYLYIYHFFGPRGPHGIPLFVRLSVLQSIRKKNLDHLYTGLMNHLKTHQTNLLALWDPLDSQP